MICMDVLSINAEFFGLNCQTRLMQNVSTLHSALFYIDILEMVEMHEFDYSYSKTCVGKLNENCTQDCPSFHIYCLPFF